MYIMYVCECLHEYRIIPVYRVYPFVCFTLSLYDYTYFLPVSMIVLVCMYACICMYL